MYISDMYICICLIYVWFKFCCSQKGETVSILMDVGSDRLFKGNSLFKRVQLSSETSEVQIYFKFVCFGRGREKAQYCFCYLVTGVVNYAFKKNITFIISYINS